jgi:catechol 2,3-dioxygenase
MMSDLPFSATTPISVAKVGLRSRDAATLAGFYQQALGLEQMDGSARTARLGAGGRVLLEIEQVDGLRPDDGRSAGLFHTAFLLPTRQDLARWARYAAERRIPITGASDHLVSEAIYLDDPDGNGIEIYADRDKSQWPTERGHIVMATNRLDMESLMGELENAPAPWQGAPDGTVVGHVHLRVGDTRAAEEWWTREIGLETMAHYGDAAVFMASGGYHHHVGANTWRSGGAGKRDDDRAGLDFVQLAARDNAGEQTHRDPWGVEIRIVPA